MYGDCWLAHGLTKLCDTAGTQARPPGARAPSPWDSATPLGRLLFSFPLPLMLRAHRVPGGLQPEMIPEIPEADWPLLKKRCGAGGGSAQSGEVKAPEKESCERRQTADQN